MAEADVLNQLKDIHLPNPVGLWPLAVGWYLLAFFVVLLGIALVYYLRKRALHAKPKQLALDLLDTYSAQYQQARNSQVTSAQISELLRRVALAYFPRDEVASLHADAWIAFLNRTGKNIDFWPVQTLLLESPFKEAEDVDMQPLLQCAKRWIKQRRKRCLN